jgi:PPOX class probable F420-dependent enzyme
MLEGPVYGVFNTHMPNGGIQSTLVWFNFDGEYIYINTKRGRVKEHNVVKNPNVSLLAVDTTNPWKYISIRGKVIDIVEENTVEHLDALTKIYLGADHYYGAVEPVEALEGITRCILKIAIEHVMTVGQ